MEGIFLCRPDDDHWCIECCLGTGCCILGDTGAGRMGCLGHHGKLTEDGLTQRPLCQDVNCLSSEQLKHKEDISRIIAKFPPGEFKMSDVQKIFKETIK